MKMIVAILQDEDDETVAEAVMNSDLCVTRIA